MATATLPRSSAGGRRRDRAYDHYFFCGMVLLILATVLAGFARTYFLAGVFRAPLPNLLIHIHGAVFTGWILLLITQTALVSAHRIDLHRRLGVAAFGFACLMVVMGVLAAGIRLRSADFLYDPDGRHADFFHSALSGLSRAVQPLGPQAADSDCQYRHPRRPHWTPAVRRHHRPSSYGKCVCLPFLLLLIGYDLWSLHKLHRVTVWASLFVVIGEAMRIPVGTTGPWLAFAGWCSISGACIEAGRGWAAEVVPIRGGSGLGYNEK